MAKQDILVPTAKQYKDIPSHGTQGDRRCVCAGQALGSREQHICVLSRTPTGAPVGHAAGDGEDGVEAGKEDAIEQHLANARRQRQRGQVAAQQRQPLTGRLKSADVLQQPHCILHRHRRRRLHRLVQKLCDACVAETAPGIFQQLHLGHAPKYDVPGQLSLGGDARNLSSVFRVFKILKVKTYESLFYDRKPLRGTCRHVSRAQPYSKTIVNLYSLHQIRSCSRQLECHEVRFQFKC